MKSIVTSIAASSLLAALAIAQQPRYTVTDLGPVGGPPGQPFVIKNNGLVSGAAAVSDTTWHAVFWYKGRKIDIGNPGLGGPSSAAFGVNERGQAVGQAETRSADPNREDFCGFGTGLVCLPFVWQYGVMTPLPTLADDSGAAGKNGAANAIDNRGEIAGVAENAERDSTCPAFNPALGQYQAFQFKPVIWEGDKIQELRTFGEDPDGIAFAVNDNGQVVGASGTCTAFQSNGDLTYLFGVHALLWQNETVTDLGNLGGTAPGGGNVAVNINNQVQVVGVSGTSDGTFHGFLWTREAGIQDFGTLQDDVASFAIGINDRGDVVGLSFDASFNSRAFLRQDGVMTDLNTLIPASSPLFLFHACPINSRGEIIGMAVDGAGQVHGYLATPGNGAADSPAVRAR